MTEQEKFEIQKRLLAYRTYETAVESMSPYDPDITVLRAELFFIRRSVLRLPESPEKLLLYRHFLCGDTMEKCAERLGISRRSVFRLRLRALELYRRYNPPGETVLVR